MSTTSILARGIAMNEAVQWVFRAYQTAPLWLLALFLISVVAAVVVMAVLIVGHGDEDHTG